MTAVKYERDIGKLTYVFIILKKKEISGMEENGLITPIPVMSIKIK